MADLRIVPPVPPPAPAEPVTMAEAIMQLAAIVAAEKPMLAMMIYETGDGLQTRCVIPSVCAERALIGAAYARAFPSSSANDC